MPRLAFIGDVHGCWDDTDTQWFAEQDYAAVIFVGDLAGFAFSKTLEIARRIARLPQQTLVVPGNHDAPHLLQLAAEVVGLPQIGRVGRGVSERRVPRLEAALGRHGLAAYSVHHVAGISLIAGRPFSMGGPRLAFADLVAATHGIRTLSESAQRLRSLVDAASERVVFVAHNGPTGLGSARSDIWGCDFKKAEGDWGDPDLREAVDYAKACGKQVLAVVAGHMHRRLKGGGDRVSRVDVDGTAYVNAAVVPRIRRGRRHHVRMVVTERGVEIDDCYVELPSS